MVYNKQNINPEFNVRKSQLLTPFGIGALIDINNQSIMVADSEYWETEKLIKLHDIRLESVLKATGFVEPPLGEISDIFGKRFPRWYFSPVDRSLKTINQWKKGIEATNKSYLMTEFDKAPFTFSNKGNNHVELVPVRIICACSHGHVQDFPWSEWAHQKTNLTKEQFSNHDLKLISQSQSASISELIVKCVQCGASNSLAGIFDKNKMESRFEKINVHCNGDFLWKQTSGNKACSENPEVLLRNASNFYFPKIMSSVNIPFNENAFLEKIMSHSVYQPLIERMTKADKGKEVEFYEEDRRIGNYILDIVEDTETDENTIREIIGKKLGLYLEGDDAVPETVMDYRRSEYAVLSGEESFNEDSHIDFKISIHDNTMLPNTDISELFTTVTLVHSLEVISALTGYSRILTSDTEKILAGEADEKEEHVVSLKRKDDTFVAVKSKGEGIFFELSKEKIDSWFEKNQHTSMIEKIIRKDENVTFSDELSSINPKFYLLHTLSHLLIKELTLTSGYSSSSLRERLYFSDNYGEEMYGVLIYTSSSDSEGTLGGLVKQGIPSNFFSIVENAIEKAKWCSFDPICIDSEGQGRNSLNVAACHACSLVSETSCEKMNVFLDRNVLVGSLQHPEWGFFTGNNS